MNSNMMNYHSEKLCNVFFFNNNLVSVDLFPVKLNYARSTNCKKQELFFEFYWIIFDKVWD